MPSFRLPALLALVLTPVGSGATVKAVSIHATEITPTKEPVVEVIKRTTTIMKEVSYAAADKQIAKPSPPTTTSLSSVWSFLRITGVVKTPSPANTSSTYQPPPTVINLIIPIVAILFIQLVASEMQTQATKQFGSTQTQTLLKGFAQRMVMPIDTSSMAHNDSIDTTFPGSVDSGFAEVEEKHMLPLPSYECDDMVPEAVDLVSDHCETQDDTRHQELLKQLVLGVLQYASTAVSQEVKLLQPSLDEYLVPPEDYEEYDEYDDEQGYEHEDYEHEDYEDYDNYNEHDEHQDRSQLFHDVLQYLDTAVSDELKALQPRLNNYLQSEKYEDGNDEEHEEYHHRSGLSKMAVEMSGVKHLPHSIIA